MPAQVLGGEQKAVTFPSMRFFFLLTTPTAIQGAWKPPQELMQHLRALRFGVDEEFLLLGASGEAWRARCLDRHSIELLGATQAPSMALHRITLATAWPKGKRAEELVLRACEAGVGQIQPLQFARSVAGRQAWGKKQAERLQRIAREACQQLRNPHLPQIQAEPLEFERWLSAVDPQNCFFLHPGAPPLADLLADANLAVEKVEIGSGKQPGTTFVIGPEGGFTDAELLAMTKAGLTAAGLSPLILRIEAAGPAAAMIAQHASTAGVGQKK